nr:RHS repeat-associated core domain-containing protein [Acinetobacter oleivorans]
MSNNIHFQGQYFDEETGFHYNRYYSPYIGRFISKDPIGLLGEYNVYSYAPNPNNWIDPLGLRSRNKTLPINARSRNTKKLVNYINADGKKLVLMMLGKMISYLIIKMMQ